MSSSTSGTHSSTWGQRVQEYRGEINRHQSQLSQQINDESAFRPEFEQLCKRRNEPNYARLQGQLRFHSINDFARAVDLVEERESSDSLVALVFSGTLAAFQAASDSKMEHARTVEPARIAELLGKLNASVPRIGVKVSHCAPDPGLRQILHTIYTVYMDILYLVIRSFRASKPETAADPLQPIRDEIENTERTFRQQDSAFQRLYDQFLTRTAARAHKESSQNARNAEPGAVHEDEHAGRYRFLTSLGRGAGGVVQKVEDCKNGRIYARKQIKIHTDADDDVQKRIRAVMREITIMEKLVHFHIAQLKDWDKNTTATELVYDLYIYPAAELNLESFLKVCQGNGSEDAEAKKIVPWFGCLLDALRFAHGHDIAHMDIKPRNILVNAHDIYLADFGISKDLATHTSGNTTMDPPMGTIPYIAPEVIDGKSDSRQFAADIFSLGCVFSEMLTTYAGSSLSDFKDARTEGGTAGPFHLNLNNVKIWLSHLQCEEAVFDVVDPLIKRMLNQLPSGRKDAETLWKWLKRNGTEARFDCGKH